jgi:hypothetical protein
LVKVGAESTEPGPRRATRQAGRRWSQFLISLAVLNLLIAGLYLSLARPWLERHYAGATYRFLKRVVIEGAEFTAVGDATLVTLLCWEAALVLALALLRHAARGRSRGRSRELALLAGSFLILLSMAEGLVRIHEKRAQGLPYLLPLSVFYDPVLGWKGKKVFGDLRSPRARVLVVGDSFTDGMGVPESAMYYAYLKAYGDPELFVYAAKGYGTLQELLVVERYIDEVNPSLVLLQVCTNDFKNNSYAIQSASQQGDNFFVSPFLEEGVVRYRSPPFPGSLPPAVAATSRLAYELFVAGHHARLQLMNRGFLPCIECRIIQGQERAAFDASVQTTGALLDRFVARVGATRLVAFPSDLAEPFYGAFTRLFRERGIPFVEEPARAIAAAEARGAKLRRVDGHWNQEGHRIVGSSLADALARLGFVPKTGTEH